RLDGLGLTDHEDATPKLERVGVGEVPHLAHLFDQDMACDRFDRLDVEIDQALHQSLDVLNQAATLDVLTGSGQHFFRSQAVSAFPAEVTVLTLAVHRLGEHERQALFAHSVGAGKKQRPRNATGGKHIAYSS